MKQKLEHVVEKLSGYIRKHTEGDNQIAVHAYDNALELVKDIDIGVPRQKLEQLIEDLKGRNRDAVMLMQGAEIGSSAMNEAYGRLNEILYVTDRLREVIQSDE